jgi:hypothetical protein
MRPSNKSRSRNKPGNNGNHNNNRPRNSMGNIINRVFESAGPDGKVRGTPQQIIDKYQALARDAQVSGDRVAAESYLQHSEHYSRLLGEAQRQMAETRSFNEQREDGQREEGGFDGQQQRRQQPGPQMGSGMGSGLAMIDPEDAYDIGGPIETPEGRRPHSEPAPVVVPVEPAPAPAPTLAPVAADPFNGVETLPAAVPVAAAAPEAEAAEPAPAKRPRPRRRHKPEGEAGEAQASTAEEAQPS